MPSLMKERPILFSAPMVRAILDGTKTQTRRVVKSQPACRLFFDVLHQEWSGVDSVFGEAKGIRCPYGQPGDRLWVRETWAEVGTCDPGLIVYRADYPNCVPRQYENVPPASEIRWKPSIHQRREHSRILLEVTGVRVERLNSIRGMDAKNEGVSIPPHLPEDGADLDYAAREFKTLWEQINGAGSWAANPWVWVVEFKRVQP